MLAANGKGLLTCALRPPVIFGEDDYQLIPTVHACIAKGETPFMIGAGDNLYDFVYIDNVADAHVLAVENMLSAQTAAGEAISISNGEPISFRDFCLGVWGACGHQPPFTVSIPASIAWFAGWMSECYTWVTGTPSTLSRGSVNDALGTRYADISKARRILNFEPRVGLMEGLQLSVRVCLCLSYGGRIVLMYASGISEARAGAREDSGREDTGVSMLVVLLLTSRCEIERCPSSADNTLGMTASCTTTPVPLHIETSSGK